MPDLTDDEREAFATQIIELARFEGCNCEPLVTMERVGDVLRAEVQHDPWCVLVDGPSLN